MDRLEEIKARLFSRTRQEGQCLIWIGCLQHKEKGYGVIGWQGKSRLVHRVAYEITNGVIPPGMTIDHLCRRRACINPDHLEVVTRGENVLRGNTITAAAKVQTACINGHPFTESNTYHWKGHRFCRTCRRNIWHKNQRAEKRREARRLLRLS